MVQALHEATGGEAIITSDVGQHQMWTAQFYDFPEPRRWINSGGLGTMGFGLPAAMGAAVGCPERLVCCVAGDGSVQMNAQELATCAQNGIPIKVFSLKVSGNIQRVVLGEDIGSLVSAGSVEA